MKRNKLMRRMIRPTCDFVLGLAVFTALASSSLASTPLVAGTAPILEPDNQAWHVAFGSPDQQLLLMIVFALFFASLVSLNLWFARHLRRAYAHRGRR